MYTKLLTGPQSVHQMLLLIHGLRTSDASGFRVFEILAPQPGSGFDQHFRYRTNEAGTTQQHV